MTVINPNSISGITSITLPSGDGNVLTIHTNDGVERFRIDSSGNVKVGSAATISPDGDLFVTGVCTATTLSGSGANLTSLPAAQLTGTVADARFPATLPAVSAANLTNVPAANVTGTLPALTAANLTNIPAANLVGVCTSGLTKTGGFGKLIQIVQDTKTNQGSDATHGSDVAISGLSVSITPTAATSKVLIFVTLTHGFSSTSSFIYRLLRDSTALNVATTDPGSPVSGYVGTVAGKQDATRGQPISITFLDEPNTTSAVTYSLTIKHNSGTWYLNTRDDNYGGASCIQAMEIGA